MGKFLKKNKIKLIVIVAVLVVFYIIASDQRLKTVEYTIETDKIENPLSLALITDLHSTYYGENQQILVDAINKENPDVVLFGGDIFDVNRPFDNSKIILKEIPKTYPCYFVTGNHEYKNENREDTLDKILDIVSADGIKILDGTQDIIEINGEKVQISGIADPVSNYYDNDKPTYNEQLDLLEENINDEYFSVLLTHRPELIEDYQKYSYDLALAGHAHGGQWRIPFILNGVYAPNQGIFPKYAGGLYEFENMDLIVSRGLSKNLLNIPRIFNRPELVIVNVV